MAIKLLDYLNPDEASEVADFLVEMIGLEEAMRAVLVDYFARPERAEVFESKLLDGMTAGRLVDLTSTALEDEPQRGDFIGEARELVRVRNAIAHTLPKTRYRHTQEDVGPDDYPYEELRAYSVGGREVDIDEIAALSLRATWARGWLAGASRPRPQFRRLAARFDG